MFAKIFKFNPNHDKATGQFTSGASSGQMGDGGGGGQMGGGVASGQQMGADAFEGGLNAAIARYQAASYPIGSGGFGRGSGGTPSSEPPKKRAVSEIAAEIRSIWSKQGKGVNYAAKPYLDAMRELESVDDNYIQDSGRSVVNYFLANATSFRGPDAQRLKLELKALLARKEEIPLPPFDVKKYNPNHDPKNGQFTSGSGDDGATSLYDSLKAMFMPSKTSKPKIITGMGMGFSAADVMLFSKIFNSR